MNAQRLPGPPGSYLAMQLLEDIAISLQDSAALQRLRDNLQDLPRRILSRLDAPRDTTYGRVSGEFNYRFTFKLEGGGGFFQTGVLVAAAESPTGLPVPLRLGACGGPGRSEAPSPGSLAGFALTELGCAGTSVSQAVFDATERDVAVPSGSVPQTPPVGRIEIAKSFFAASRSAFGTDSVSKLSSARPYQARVTSTGILHRAVPQHAPSVEVPLEASRRRGARGDHGPRLCVARVRLRSLSARHRFDSACIRAPEPEQRASHSGSRDSGDVQRAGSRCVSAEG